MPSPPGSARSSKRVIGRAFSEESYNIPADKALADIEKELGD
jgi:hypothetical protein